jgi:hypothetical protein
MIKNRNHNQYGWGKPFRVDDANVMRQRCEEPLTLLRRWNELSISTQSYLTQKGLVFKSEMAFDAFTFKNVENAIRRHKTSRSSGLTMGCKGQASKTAIYAEPIPNAHRITRSE